ncbi:hypothetical protein CUMW_273150 [Citrus unshiu]|uniref:AB hydrolase-1 domain-containing protein n=1 Tax=Citrus unshiu TaxID=55188 RepID=A0A2H5MVN5_CITUN|nr:hypothetical protein CUMW_273150 [Citrus unshiu]
MKERKHFVLVHGACLGAWCWYKVLTLLKLAGHHFGSVDRVYVICKEDEVMKEDFQRAMIEDYHPKQVVSISAAGHMVMLSKPEELCQILLEDIAHK